MTPIQLCNAPGELTGPAFFWRLTKTMELSVIDGPDQEALTRPVPALSWDQTPATGRIGLDCGGRKTAQGRICGHRIGYWHRLAERLSYLPMHRIEDVERTQAELDLLYGELAEMAGNPGVDAMLILLRITDKAIEDVRQMAIDLNQASR